MKGRVIINTGNGKGKTTAALGTAFRALGYNQRVCVIQFLKGQGEYGERLMAKKVDNLDWYISGRGFVFSTENIEQDREVAEEGILLAKEKIESDRYDLVILDEITYLPLFNLVAIDTIIDIITNRPARLNLILTGRDAHERLIEVADTVSVIEPLKHGFEQGIKAQRGVEF